MAVALHEAGRGRYRASLFGMSLFVVVAGCSNDEPATAPEASASSVAVTTHPTASAVAMGTASASGAAPPQLPPWHLAPGSAPAARPAASASVSVSPPSLDALGATSARCPERIRRRLFVLQGARVLVDESTDQAIEGWTGTRLPNDTSKRMRPLVSVAEGAEPWRHLRVWPCDGAPVTLTRQEADATLGDQPEWWLKSSGRGSVKLLRRTHTGEGKVEKQVRVLRGLAAITLHSERPAPWAAPAGQGVDTRRGQ